MKFYIPNIIANSPTKLPFLEKVILYYIIDEAFKSQLDKNQSSDLEIDINQLLNNLNNTTIDFEDIKSQTKSAINNLGKIKLSLVDNGFHIKLAPIESVYILSNTLYITLNPIIIDYLDQIFSGEYTTYDLLKDPILHSSKE